MNGFDGIYSSLQSRRRREQVLERKRAGIEEKRIAKDLGIAPYAVTGIVEQLQRDGELSATSAA